MSDAAAWLLANTEDAADILLALSTPRLKNPLKRQHTCISPPIRSSWSRKRQKLGDPESTVEQLRWKFTVLKMRSDEAAKDKARDLPDTDVVDFATEVELQSLTAHMELTEEAQRELSRDYTWLCTLLKSVRGFDFAAESGNCCRGDAFPCRESARLLLQHLYAVHVFESAEEVLCALGELVQAVVLELREAQLAESLRRGSVRTLQVLHIYKLAVDNWTGFRYIWQHPASRRPQAGIARAFVSVGARAAHDLVTKLIYGRVRYWLKELKHSTFSVYDLVQTMPQSQIGVVHYNFTLEVDLFCRELGKLWYSGPPLCADRVLKLITPPDAVVYSWKLWEVWGFKWIDREHPRTRVHRFARPESDLDETDVLDFVD